jgi:uncharacterized protein YbjT (DUF2867 family)
VHFERHNYEIGTHAYFDSDRIAHLSSAGEQPSGRHWLAGSGGSGVNTITGEGLADALVGAQVVVDLANSPSFEAKPALEFFQMAGRNLLAAEATAGVGHHIALSVVGTDHLQGSGYFRAKLAQENLIKGSTIPYTIVRSTQFFEFMSAIAQSGTVGQAVHLSTGYLQPIASDDVAAAMTEVALGPPVNGMIEIAGPERAPLSEFVGRFLKAANDPCEVVADAHAPYFGLELDDRSLVPGDNNELVWDKAVFLQKLAHQLQRRPLVPPGLDQHIEHFALGIDGAPQIEHAVIDFQIDFVQIPPTHAGDHDFGGAAAREETTGDDGDGRASPSRRAPVGPMISRAPRA